MASASWVHEKAASLGKLALEMTTVAGAGHPSSSLSLAHLVTYLMYRQMRYDPAAPRNPNNDRLVLSEGHAVPIVYAAYADLHGAVQDPHREGTHSLKIEELDGLRARDSVLDGHPNPAEGFPFFDAATGSLGQGLSVAAGLALAARLDGLDRRIYTIIGDGESREGQIWEAVDFIVDHKLTHICAIFNCNAFGQAAAVSPQQSPQRIADKLRAYGWSVREIDGHDPAAIEEALSHFPDAQSPLAIVAKTIKGWGVGELLKGNWHGKPLPQAELQAAYASLDRAVAGKTGGAAPRPQAPASGKASAARAPCAGDWPSFEEVMSRAGLGDAVKKGKIATRRAYGAALRAAGDLCEQVVALDADVSNSTFSELFRDAHPQRFIECKIAEQNMVSVAAGLSAAGRIPFVNTFAKFVARAYDQVEMANISRANIKIVGSHSGVSLASDGPSQMSLLDVAYFRSLAHVRGDDRKSPLCWVFQPSDAVGAYHCTRAMLGLPGMCYMRTFRPDTPLLYAADTAFPLGGFHVLTSGEDLALVSGGYMTHVAKAAVERLSRQGVRVTLIDAYCLPIDRDPLIDILRKAGRRALVVEDNYGGGLGAEVAEAAAQVGDIRVAALFCQRIPKSTRTAEEALEYVGVGEAQIADHAMALLKTPR